MEVGLEVASKKAALILGGPVKVSENIKLPFYPSRSTAGPGAGSTSIVLAFQGARIKKAISRDSGDFELRKQGESYQIWKDGVLFLDKVELKPTLFHAPEQAFFNLDSQCIYDCKFCTSPLLDKKATKNLTPDKVVSMIKEASKRPDLKAVALTSAVPDSAAETVERLAYVIRRTRKELGAEMPIGVEPYVSSLQDIDLLKEAGADEIKLNIETFDREIFEKVCGGQDLDWILEAIEHAVQVFGRGKVTSNIIVGLGESDESVIAGIETLARMGCVATLRPLKVNELNRERLRKALGEWEPLTKERLLRLASKQKEILTRYGLTTLSFNSMCHACTCCDIVPFRDL